MADSRKYMYPSTSYPSLPSASENIADLCLLVPTEQRAAYAAIIDDVLATSDLLTISAKRIRKTLQEKVDYDISSQKVRPQPLSGAYTFPD
jgi:hypothetical protein